jgi:hypothetical protein
MQNRPKQHRARRQPKRRKEHLKEPARLKTPKHPRCAVREKKAQGRKQGKRGNYGGTNEKKKKEIQLEHAPPSGGHTEKKRKRNGDKKEEEDAEEEEEGEGEKKGASDARAEEKEKRRLPYTRRDRNPSQMIVYVLLYTTLHLHIFFNI